MIFKPFVTLLNFVTMSVTAVIVLFLTAILAYAAEAPEKTILAAEVRQERGSIPFRNAITRYYGGVRTTDEMKKIIGGEIASWDDHKWQAALLVAKIPDRVKSQFCGGSLVRQDWVVTAAHCVDYFTSAQAVHVLTGTANLSSGGKLSNVEAIYIHKDYDESNRNNDIALLKLKDNGVGKPITPITEKEEPSIVVSGQNTMITGWGVTESGFPSPQLKQVSVPLVNHDKCNGPASYDGVITDKMICAGVDEGTRDSCQGDSGGPNTKDGFLIGIVSWGEGCGKQFKYGVYTRVSQFADWIEACVKNPASCKPQ